MSVLDRLHGHGRPGAHWRRGQGFTLVELMVTIAVLAILMAIAVPSFQNQSLSSRLRASANDLAAGVQLARSEAIKRNAVVQLCASSDGSSCGGGWADGWIVLAADNTRLHAQAALPAGYKVTAQKEGTGTTVAALKFQASGVGLKLDDEATAASAEFRICRASPLGSQERTVRVSSTGRATVTRTDEGSCP